MTGEEFRKLWKIFDSSGDGKISYTEFNNQIGPLVSPPSMGLQLKRPETPKMKEWQRKAVARAMKKKVTDIEQTFKDIDTDGSGKISHAEFIQALRNMGVRGIGDTESWQMMTKYRRAGNETGEMTFDEFKDCMLDYLRIPSDSSIGAEEVSPAYLSAEQAIERAIGHRTDALLNAFTKLDPEGRTDLDYSQFRQALESVGIRLSKEEFQAVVQKWDPSDDGGINYRDFLLHVSGLDAHASDPAPAVNNLPNLHELNVVPIINPATNRPYTYKDLAKRVAPRVGLTEVEVRLIYDLFGRKENLKEAFTRFDVNRDGKVTAQELRRALDSLNIDVTDDMISILFSKYDTNHDSTVDYEEFNNRLGSFLVPSEFNLSRLLLTKVGDSSSSSTTNVATTTTAAPGTPSKTGTPRAGGDSESVATAALDLSPTAQKIRKVLGKSGYNAVLADVKKEASKRNDPTATVGSNQLRDTLAKHGVPLTGKEARALSYKYHGNGPAPNSSSDGVVDVESMLKDTFISSPTAKSSTTKVSSAVKPSPRK